MTDENPVQPSPRSPPAPTVKHPTNGSVQLDYPQLLLEASLQSLLTHSQSSAASTVITMPRSNAGLSESWASLSDAEFSQDDDLRSEMTDVGSLIDGASVNDVHSVHESGRSSDDEEPEGDDDTDHSGILMQPEQESVANQIPSPYQHVPSFTFPTTATGTGLVNMDPDGSAHSLLGSDDASVVSPFQAPEAIPDQITIPKAKSRLDQYDRPFRVLCLSTKSISSESRSAVFSKIGAALVVDMSSPRDTHNFHVIPSQFGPGFRPEASELIPVTKQLAIHECGFPSNASFVSKDRDGHSVIALPDGSSLVCTGSRSARVVNHTSHEYRPDLLVCMTSANDSVMEHPVVIQIISLARADALPMIAIRDNTSSKQPHWLRLEANSVHKYLTSLHESGSSGRVPVSVEEFCSFDSDDLNKHLQFLMESVPRHPQPKPTQASGTPQKYDVFNWLKAQKKDDEGGSDEFSQLPPEEKRRSIDSPHSTSKLLHEIWTNLKAYIHLILAVAISMLLYAFFTSGDRSFSSPPSAGDVSKSDMQFTGQISSSPSLSLAPVATPSGTEESTKKTGHSDLSLLSGMLHEVAEYWPLQQPLAKPEISTGSREKQQAIKTHKAHTCDKVDHVTTARRGGVVVVPDGYYAMRDPIFVASLSRGKRAVPFHIEHLGYDRHAIRVDSSELYGLLQLSLSVPGKSHEATCVHVNLKDTPIESLASIVNGGSASKEGAFKKSPTEWTLLRLRRESHGTLPGVREMTRYAMKTIDAAHAVVEDRAVAQVVACYHDSDECWLRKAKLLEKQVSTLAQNYEKRVVTSASQVCGRAKVLADEAVHHASKALDLMRRSMTDLGDVSSRARGTQRKLSKHLSHKARKAQRRARKIVREHMRR